LGNSEKETRVRIEERIIQKEMLRGIVVAVLIVSVTFIFFSPGSPTNQAFQLKAVIVD
jgi:hypothetical protein